MAGKRITVGDGRKDDIGREHVPVVREDGRVIPVLVHPNGQAFYWVGAAGSRTRRGPLPKDQAIAAAKAELAEMG